MARKCDTTKYRKRREQEKTSHERHQLQRQKEESARREYWAMRHAQEQEARTETQLADPRRPYIQRVVNLLRAKVEADPLWPAYIFGKVWGVDVDGVIEGVTRFGVRYIGGEHEITQW